MRTHFLIATALAFATTGCIVEHDLVREPSPTAQVEAAPPPPQDDADAPSEVNAAPPPVERNVDTQVFYDRLSGYGHWEYTPEYGRVWIPNVAANWRPYYYGNWQLTDWGWTFASDDPWGWAAYHYGSWGYGPSLGWYWVPGSVWAPAWVSWRYGGGYVSWCPIGPGGYAYGYNNRGWVAVGEQHFTQPIATAAVSVHATAGIVQGSAPLTGPHATPVKGGAFGPPVAQVAAATGQQIHPVSAASVVGRPQARAMAGNGDSYHRPGSDPIRSPTPRASSSPSVSTAGVPAARGSQAGAAAGAQGAPAARPGASGIGPERAVTPAPRGPGAGRTPIVVPAPRGLGRGSSAPAPRGLGSGSSAPAPRGLGSGSSAPAPRGLGSGSARPSGAPRSSGGGASRPAPAPRNSGGGGGASHPAPAPAPAARPSGGGSHSRK